MMMLHRAHLHDDHHPVMNPPQHEERPSSSTQTPTNQTSSNRLNSRNSSFMRRSDGYSRRRRSPLNSGLWISVELVVTVSQIIASIVVLSLSRHENPRAPLFAWVVGYASGCFATLPILYWRYRTRNQSNEQESSQSRQVSSQNNPSSEPTSYTAISVNQASETAGAATRRSRFVGIFRMRYRDSNSCMLLSAEDTGIQTHCGLLWAMCGYLEVTLLPLMLPNCTGLCIVFLTFSCIGYAMPFILCATICCCLPCIISILGFREDLSQTRGAAPESIDALPTYKFKLKKNGDVDDQEVNSGAGEGGVLAAGTEKSVPYLVKTLSMHYAPSVNLRLVELVGHHPMPQAPVSTKGRGRQLDCKLSMEILLCFNPICRVMYLNIHFDLSKLAWTPPANRLMKLKGEKEENFLDYQHDFSLASHSDSFAIYGACLVWKPGLLRGRPDIS
ncbi:hypothetical protein CK203_110345 [Vitis vinifera]|uniref:E3 ubiquitin-protein ligase n=1 Tax=Vitis vinifera TaxID=29760 RepID=A0A438D0D8_VITVI|nr:hypothetical protein CK203_110345 [Vitis vinifera]